MEKKANNGSAKQENYRPRSALKLLEINTKLNLLKSCSKVLELGSSPGEWTQVLVEKLKSPEITITAVDILPMQPIPGVNFLQLDLTRDSSIQEIQKATGNYIDLVISDMSNNSDNDCIGLFGLNLIALRVSQSVLKPGGAVLMKMPHCGTEPEHFVMIT